MTLPFQWPSAPAGSEKGRLTEIASFRRSKIPDARFQQVLTDVMGQVSQFPISRQNLAGTQLENSEMFVLVADWTSAEEKDIFEPGTLTLAKPTHVIHIIYRTRQGKEVDEFHQGEQYQSIKPTFGELVNPEDTEFQCHHMILPDGPSTTPATGFYVVYRMRVPVEKHNSVSSAFQDYAETLRDEHGYTFIHIAPSREDSEQVVCFVGLRGQEDAERAKTNVEHDKLVAKLEQLVIEGVKYGVVLKKV